MSKDDEATPGEWNPEDDKIDDKFKRTMMKFVEHMMSEADRMKGEEAGRRRVVLGRAAPPFGGDYIAAIPGQAYVAEPSVMLRKIANGWLVGYQGAAGYVELFAALDGIPEAVKAACIETEKQYEQSKKILAELNTRHADGGLGLAP